MQSKESCRSSISWADRIKVVAFSLDIEVKIVHLDTLAIVLNQLEPQHQEFHLHQCPLEPFILVEDKLKANTINQAPSKPVPVVVDKDHLVYKGYHGEPL